MIIAMRLNKACRQKYKRCFSSLAIIFRAIQRMQLANACYTIFFADDKSAFRA